MIFGIRNTGCILLIWIFCLPILHSQNMTVFDGAIKSYSNLSNPISGMIQWTGADLIVWNGSKWISLLNQQSFGTVADIDGNRYRTVIIGAQEWMAENLRTTRYRNGVSIPHVPDQEDWSAIENLLYTGASKDAWCWQMNNSTNELIYGKLYNWHAVAKNDGICPTGWRIPTEDDIMTLSEYLSGPALAASDIKAAGTAFWNDPNVATNSSGFSALPGGRRSDAFPSSLGGRAYFWTSTSASVIRYRRTPCIS